MAWGTYPLMEFRKMISEEKESGDYLITYLGLADYQVSSRLKWYTGPESEDESIWRIKKTIEDRSTGITETFYPDADPAKTYAWSDRENLNYI